MEMLAAHQKAPCRLAGEGTALLDFRERFFPALTLRSS
jgi:hypothetical protein